MGAPALAFHRWLLPRVSDVGGRAAPVRPTPLGPPRRFPEARSGAGLRLQRPFSRFRPLEFPSAGSSLVLTGELGFHRTLRPLGDVDASGERGGPDG